MLKYHQLSAQKVSSLFIKKTLNLVVKAFQQPINIKFMGS